MVDGVISRRPGQHDCVISPRRLGGCRIDVYRVCDHNRWVAKLGAQWQATLDQDDRCAKLARGDRADAQEPRLDASADVNPGANPGTTKSGVLSCRAGGRKDVAGRRSLGKPCVSGRQGPHTLRAVPRKNKMQSPSLRSVVRGTPFWGATCCELGGEGRGSGEKGVWTRCPQTRRSRAV